MTSGRSFHPKNEENKEGNNPLQSNGYNDKITDDKKMADEVTAETRETSSVAEKPKLVRTSQTRSESQESEEPSTAMAEESFVPEVEEMNNNNNNNNNDEVIELETIPTLSNLTPHWRRSTRRQDFRKQSSVALNSSLVEEKLRRNPQLQLVSNQFNTEEKELFVVVREGDTDRAIEILKNEEVHGEKMLLLRGKEGGVLVECFKLELPFCGRMGMGSVNLKQFKRFERNIFGCF